MVSFQVHIYSSLVIIFHIVRVLTSLLEASSLNNLKMNLQLAYNFLASYVFYTSGVQPGVREDILGGT
jgi:hypothetical protein